MTDKEVFEAVQQRFTDPKIMDLLRAGLVNKDEMEDAKRALRYGDAVMRNPILRDKLYKIFDRLLNVVKDDSTTRQMVKQDLRQLQKQSGDSAMSENLDTANVEKAVKHDCAKHVVHEQWGKGQCIPGEHTLLDDGTVTHYDVMFEHGIEQNVAVEDLTVVVSESHMHAKKKKAMEEEAVTPEGGEDSSKASKKGKPEMPLEKLKAIMEKKKMKMKKMMEDANEELINESKIKVKSNFEDGYGPVEVHIHHPDGTKKKITSKHWYNEDPGEDNGYSRSEHQEYRAHLEKHHGLSSEESHAVAKHFDKIYKGKATDSDFTYGKHVSEEVEQVAENIEDRHGEVYSDFDDHIEKVPQEHRAALHREFERHNKMFDKAHRNDDDEHMEHALGNMRDVLDRVKKHAGAKLDEKKLTSAEMKKREEVAKAIKRDNPEMPMGKKMAIATATAKKVAEAKAHTVPKTAKEKSLAALAAPHDKITHADVMVGRGVSKKKTMKEFVEKLAESLSPKAE